MTQITKEGFKEWLQAKEPEIIVGSARLCAACPIANYLNSVTGKVLVVGSTYWISGNMEASMQLPSWAAEFINKVDRKIGPRLISAQYALTLLDQVES